MIEENFIKAEILKHLEGGMAFQPLTNFINDIPFAVVGKRLYDLPYSFYEVFYHVCYAQKDIVDFILAEGYYLPNWPDDYWPNSQQPESRTSWIELIKMYKETNAQLAVWVKKESTELAQPVKHASKEEQTLLRELLLLIEHAAYHTGQLVLISRLLKVYKP